MAIAHARFDHRHGRILHHAANQPRAAARNQQVNIAVHPHQRRRALATGILNQDHAVRIHARFLKSAPERMRNGRIGANGLASASQYAGVTALKAQRRRIASHIRPRLINHTNHAKGHGAPLQSQAVYQRITIQHPAHGISHGGHLAHAVRHALKPRFVHAQPIQHRLRHTARARRVHILRVRCKYILCRSQHFIRHRAERVAFLRCARRCQRPRRSLCTPSNILHIQFHIICPRSP